MSRRAHRVVETDDGKFHVTLTRKSVLVRKFYSRARPVSVSLDEIVELSKGLKPEPIAETENTSQLNLFP